MSGIKNDVTFSGKKNGSNIRLVWIAVAILATIGVIVGVVVGVKKISTKDSKSAEDLSMSKNTMSCDSSMVTVKDDFTIMPMDSIDLPTDMTTMNFMELECLGDSAVFNKTKSEMHTMENGDNETIWTGAIMESGQMGFATIVQSPDGIAGSFTTDTATYSLFQAPDGTMQMKMILWSDIPDESAPEEESSTGTVNNATILMEDVLTGNP